jgi:hypothetical protein
MTTWVKEDGKEIELNDLPATEEKAKSLGWAKKKGRKKKASK